VAKIGATAHDQPSEGVFMSQESAKAFVERIRASAQLLDRMRKIGSGTKALDEMIEEMVAVSNEMGLECTPDEMRAAVEASIFGKEALKAALISKLNVKVPERISEEDMFPAAVIETWPHPRA
jgi:hypothetical protein